MSDKIQPSRNPHSKRNLFRGTVTLAAAAFIGIAAVSTGVFASLDAV